MVVQGWESTMSPPFLVAHNFLHWDSNRCMDGTATNLLSQDVKYLMGFKIHCPKIWHLDIWVNSKKQEDLSNLLQVFSPEASHNRIFWPSSRVGHETLIWNVSSLTPREGAIEDTVTPRGIYTTVLAKFPQSISIVAHPSPSPNGTSPGLGSLIPPMHGGTQSSLFLWVDRKSVV